MSAYAGIVTYHPEIARLKCNIEAIINQVEKLVIFDNCSDNIEELEQLMIQYPGAWLIKSEENVGIAAAFNNILRYGQAIGMEWVLLLDQDSICPEHMIDEYIPYTKEPKVAIISPLVIDRRRAARDMKIKSETQEINNCVSSGSFVNISICQGLGLFEEKLFIDVVDYEYCMRVRLNGYRVLRVNGLVLDQEFGNVAISKHARTYQKLADKTRIRLFHHLAYSPVYSPARVKLTIRNWVYCIRKYKRFSHTWKEICKLIKGCIIIIVRGKFQFKLAASILYGVKSGFSLEVNPVKIEQYHVKIDLM